MRRLLQEAFIRGRCSCRSSVYGVAITWDQVLIRGNAVGKSNETRTNNDTNDSLYLTEILKEFLFGTIMFYIEITSTTSCGLFQ